MSDDALTVVCILFLIAFGAFLGVLGGSGYQQTKMRRAAIEANVAEWTIDAKTGVAEFRYRPCGEGTQ